MQPGTGGDVLVPAVAIAVVIPAQAEAAATGDRTIPGAIGCNQAAHIVTIVSSLPNYWPQRLSGFHLLQRGDHLRLGMLAPRHPASS